MYNTHAICPNDKAFLTILARQINSKIFLFLNQRNMQIRSHAKEFTNTQCNITHVNETIPCKVSVSCNQNFYSICGRCEKFDLIWLGCYGLFVQFVQLSLIWLIDHSRQTMAGVAWPDSVG